jgi:hypothetical protein
MERALGLPPASARASSWRRVEPPVPPLRLRPAVARYAHGVPVRFARGCARLVHTRWRVFEHRLVCVQPSLADVMAGAERSAAFCRRRRHILLGTCEAEGTEGSIVRPCG